jgi:hypothetical protein
MLYEIDPHVDSVRFAVAEALLCRSMLKKDPSKRPTIDEILEKDFVHKRLHAQVT